MLAEIKDILTKEIDEGYKNMRIPKIQKETQFILNSIIIRMINSFQDRIYGISIEPFEMNQLYIISDKNKKQLYNWIQRWDDIKPGIDNISFGKIKIELESWFYDLGGKYFHIFYRENFLLSPKEAAKKLGVSTDEIHDYVKMGLEIIQTSTEYKVPKDAVELWPNTVYCLKIQKLYHQKKVATQTLEEQLQDIREKILDYQKQYKKLTSKEAFAGVDIESLDNPYDYREWQELENLEEKILKRIIGEKNNL